MSLSKDQAKELLPLLVDALPPRELEVVNALFWEGASVRVVALRMNLLDKRGRPDGKAVSRIRDRALKRLGEVLEDGALWDD
jgi:hypothetical protein